MAFDTYPPGCFIVASWQACMSLLYREPQLWCSGGGKGLESGSLCFEQAQRNAIVGSSLALQTA